MPVTYVICAAGAGSRLSGLVAGIPKPAIRFQGKTMLEWSVSSLHFFPGDRLVVVTQKQHRLKQALLPLLQAGRPFLDIRWVEVDGLTRGQLETVYLARKQFPGQNALAVFNADTYFECRGFLPLAEHGAADGIIVCSREKGSNWSFCKTRRDGTVIEVREKERISGLATVGLYYFRSTPKFLRYCAGELAASRTGEYFVAPLYNRYIAGGATVVAVTAERFKPFGSPEQIRAYWGCGMEGVAAENASEKVIVCDLDNTITIDDPGVPYARKRPNRGVIRKLREYKKEGYTIIIHSARRMLTHRNDESKVVADVAATTVQWLSRHKVPYDGLRFGKPFAKHGFYIDDRAVRPGEFLALSPREIESMLRKCHEQFA